MIPTIQDAAETLLTELEENRLVVGLLPAPDPCHSGHCVRAAFTQNPRWFQVLNAEKRLRRDRATQALRRIAENRPRGSADEKRLSGLIQDRLKELLSTQAPEAIETQPF